MSSAYNFGNRLDPDQARQHVGPNLDPIFLDIQMVFLKEFFEKVNFEKKNEQTTKRHEKIRRGQS